ncbi:MAG: glycosyltransferase family 4 protein [Planctomycetes bacterium]|nr:glycosyltransferase family 4 protein [Planctomycetota bacterium]
MKLCLFGDAQSVHLRRIAAGLARRAARVHVVTHKPADIPGVSVERFCVPRPGLMHPRRWRVRWANYLKGFLRRFDVVHVHFLQDWGFRPEIVETGCFAATPWGSDIVPPPGEGTPTPELTAVRVAMLRRANLVTAWGPRFAATVSAVAGIPARDIALLPLGVDLSLFHAAAHPAEPRSGGPRIGFFKGFRETYGAAYLVRAIPRVLESYPAARFELIGDGPQLTECRALAEQLSVQPSIQWVPRQRHEDLPRHLAGWDVSVVPSVCESFGAAALESSAMGVPVVASHVGGLPDTVRDGETGLLVPPADSDRLADAIATLLRDDELRRRMSIAGREFVARNYEWGGILDRWVDVYEAAINRAAGRNQRRHRMAPSPR